MALYLIEHSHTTESCPTQNLDMVRRLRGHVTTARCKYSGDWVSEAAHGRLHR